ncbi:UDP-N-acetylgalactosamine-undecaprenyl-phosphate N-acetylgalactosaminephosphotransferase [Kordia antarctica]|uniref:UDP-N-acetylgalactosamine-undecaprenyl-phosphate N-acetylgalactosaminephosphotransferase n=1 Tax=Kordia antarctica TaxID=1218801 RepID=A0A7L4ZH37_9FLAO|nr:sugar transferase [Kordia antarctica]QHI35214.1 UDP-N-acetylgalactosamine-undecaprenyl-phosphate N-acetylgalactosaminephosphotransferase [Kordia antarctica]
MASKSNIHFEISERKLLLRVFDVVALLFGLYLVSNIFDFDYFMITQQRWVWTLVLIVYFLLFSTIFELYDLQKSSRFESTFQGIVLSVSITVLCYLLTPFLTPELPVNRLQILYFFLAISVAIFLWRCAYIFFISSPRFFKNILLIGNTQEIKVMLDAINSSTNYYEIVGYINSSSDTSVKAPELAGLEEIKNLNLKEIAQQKAVSEIIIASNEREELSKPLFDSLISLLETGLPIKEYTQVYEELMFRVPLQYIGKDFYKYFPFSRSNQNKLYLFSHRLFDIVFSILGLVASLIFLPFVLIGNLIGNRGPLVYTQERVGKNGVPFKIYKLRSMVIDAEKDGAVWATRNDTRITKFGGFLRKSRLDEVPQFFNVLKGEMSMIGPRPERPAFVKQLSESLTFYEIRHVVKPGVTGWAQVKTDYGASEEDSLRKLQYDLYYIKHRSLFLDVNIVVKTLSTVLFYRGR